jgi:protein-tyrosine phosphatase
LRCTEVKTYFGEKLNVLDLAGEFPELAIMRCQVNYYSLPLLDATAPTLSELNSAVRWIEQTKSQAPVYVHCALGRGRSATVILAYLLKSGMVSSVSEGIRFLKPLRKVKLHPQQRHILETWHNQLHSPVLEQLSNRPEVR